MNSTLIRLAVRQAVMPTFGVVAAIIVVLLALNAILVRATGDPGVEAVSTALFVPLLLWSGFLAGARPFSREFRERHFLLVQVLPVGRGEAWASTMLGGAFTGLASLLLALLVRRPSLVRLLGEMQILDDGPGTVSFLVLLYFLYLVLFGAGSCYALLLSGTAVHAVGFVATILMLAVIGALVAGFRGDPQVFVPVVQTPSFHLADLGAAVSMALLMYFTLSLAFFARGEFVVARVRWRNGLVLLAGHLACLALIGAGFEAWIQTRPFVLEEGDLAVAPDGAHLALIERRYGYPSFSRLRLIETGSGRASSVDVQGARWLRWSGDGSELVLLSSESSPWRRLGYLLPSVEAAMRVGPDGRIKQFESFSRGEAAEGLILAGGVPALALRSGTSGRVVALEPGKTLAEMLRIEDLRAWVLGRIGEGLGYVVADSTDGKAQVWVLRPQARKVAFNGTWTPSQAPPLIFGDMAVSWPNASAELERRFPLPPALAGRERPKFVSWDFADRPGWLFAVLEGPGDHDGDVLARDPKSETWLTMSRSPARELPKEPGLATSEVHSLSPDEFRPPSPGSCVLDLAGNTTPLGGSANWSRSSWLCPGGAVLENTRSPGPAWVLRAPNLARELPLASDDDDFLFPRVLPNGSLSILSENLARLRSLRSSHWLTPLPDRAYVLRPGAAELETYQLGGLDDWKNAVEAVIPDGGLVYSSRPRQQESPRIHRIRVATRLSGDVQEGTQRGPADRQLWPIP